VRHVRHDRATIRSPSDLKRRLPARHQLQVRPVRVRHGLAITHSPIAAANVPIVATVRRAFPAHRARRGLPVVCLAHHVLTRE